MEFKRGEIYRFNLEPTQGSEQQGIARPCVVLSLFHYQAQQKFTNPFQLPCHQPETHQSRWFTSIVQPIKIGLVSIWEKYLLRIWLGLKAHYANIWACSR
jgi:hypothetical protein